MTEIEHFGSRCVLPEPIIAENCEACGSELYDYQVTECPSCGKRIHKACSRKCSQCGYDACIACLIKDEDTAEYFCGEGCLAS